MADKRRFALFADLIAARFPGARRVFDVAGGAGRLNAELLSRGLEPTTFDRKPAKKLVAPDLRYAERRFTLEEPCACDLVVGMHPDGATRVIVEYARLHRVPFAVVPCCADNGLSYGLWMKHLLELARAPGAFARVEEVMLEMQGRARALLGFPAA